jgi:hypothetical protein
MPRLNVIFDTNVYRGLARGTVDELRHMERSEGVAAIASVWPTMELAVHVADPGSKDFSSACRGFATLWRHTQYYDGSRSVVPLAADSEAQLAWTLFQAKLPRRSEEMEGFGYVLGAFGSRRRRSVPKRLQPFFAAMNRHVTSREAQFSADMKAIVSLLDPKATGWLPFARSPTDRKRVLSWMKEREFLVKLAGLRVRATAAEVGTSISEADEEALGAQLLALIPTPFHFYRNLLIGLVESGTDFSKSKHANSLWDMHLSFVVAPKGRIDGRALLLVTNEGKIATAAAQAGNGEFVMNYTTYAAMLRDRKTEGLVDQLGSPAA